MPCRMYKSLAAIDQIDGIECTHKLGYFESRFCKDDEDYNDHVTRHNTNMNSVFMPQDSTKPASGGDIASEARLRGGGRGGRGADMCDKRCTRHRQPEAQHTQKIPKVNRAERMKREAQRRRKERKEREKEEKEKEKNKHIVSDPEVVARTSNKISHEKLSEGASSPVGRRGSVSHVEQRLAERHERQQERLEKQEREERRSSISGRRRGSVDCDRSTVTEKMRTSKTGCGLGVSHDRPRSTTPTRRHKGKKGSNEGSDVSQASSMESVDGNLDSPRSPARPKRPTSLNLPEIKIIAKPSPKSEDENDNIVKQESQGFHDEAYVSLEEPSLYIRSRSLEDNESNESDRTLVENKQETRTQEALEAIQNLVIKEASELDVYPEKDNNTETNKAEKNQSLQVASERGLANSGELTAIQEEDGDSHNKSPRSFLRSVSNSSDIGSMISEGSESSMDREDGLLRSPGVDGEFQSEWKGRLRSMSIQPGCNNAPSKSRGRARSNSIHLEPNVNNRARPWGELCNGAVARAMEKFNIKEEAMTTAGRTIQQRRLSTPVISPTEEESAFLP